MYLEKIEAKTKKKNEPKKYEITLTWITDGKFNWAAPSLRQGENLIVYLGTVDYKKSPPILQDMKVRETKLTKKELKDIEKINVEED